MEDQVEVSETLTEKGDDAALLELPGSDSGSGKGGIEALCELVKRRVTLTSMTPDMWKESHIPTISKFLTDPNMRLLVVYLDEINGLTVDLVVPNHQNASEITYFIKRLKVLDITESNFSQAVQWGTLRSGYLEGLLRLMNGIFAPMFFQNTTWPDSIKNDFSSQLHRFLASLTDIKHKMLGKTVLYIPSEGLMEEPDIAAKNKELVQRLETAMIHWTRQIKEVLNAQDALETSESSGPLEEIEFWNNRCIDLSGYYSSL